MKITDCPALGYRNTDQGIDALEKIFKVNQVYKVKESEPQAKPAELIKVLRAADSSSTGKNEFQEIHARVYRSGVIIEDPQASNFAAVKIAGNTNAWALQYPLPSTFRIGNKDVLNVVVRCDVSPSLPAAAPVFAFGFVGPEGMVQTKTLNKDIGDAGYHTYRLKLNSKPNASVKAPLKYFWLAPQGKDAGDRIRSVTVDKMYLTSEKPKWVMATTGLIHRTMAVMKGFFTRD
jgi:hypothetical protein